MKRKVYIFLYLFFLEIKRILLKTKYQAEFDLTDNCNLKCEHCYHFNNPPKVLKKDETSIDIWEERFNQLYEKGIRFVLLGGGEPALRRDAIELACQKFPIVHVITNGQIKISEKFENLIIFLSLDGSREKSDAIRGKGSFERAINNYSGDGRVIINMTLMVDNYTDLEKVIKIAKENFFRGVVCNFYNSNKNHDPLIMNKNERAIAIQELRRVKKIHPRHFLLTKAMIDWYAKTNHEGYCYWGDEVLHFDSFWKSRRCFSGLNCANCGCFAGSLQSPVSSFFYIKEMLKFI